MHNVVSEGKKILGRVGWCGMSRTMDLNRERIIKALECCTHRPRCRECSYTIKQCENVRKDALSLIKELTAENEQFRYEQGKLIEERDTFREYAYNMQKYVENIKHKEEVGYEPSAARYAAEMDMWRVVALKKKELTEENDRLKVRVLEENHLRHQAEELLANGMSEVKADTVRKMHSEIKERCIKGGIYPAFVARTIEQVTKEMCGV